ncbi:MAG TPA: ABC transporter permease [Bacteroidales bacterium]|nr:ABC transporter permease [Bacteroidales bacterium]
MRKILIIALREYKAAVKTKSFIISLVMLPVLMGGSVAVSIIAEKKVDTTDKKFAVIDHSGLFEESLKQSVKFHNEVEIYKPDTKEKIKPAYQVEFITPDNTDLVKQKLELSDRVSSKDLTGFLEIGSSVLHPDADPQNAYVRFYSETSILDETQNWFSNPINNHLRELRIADLHLSPDSTKELFYWTNIEGLGLLKKDVNSGQIKDAEKSNPVTSLLIPYILVMMMFMMGMVGSMPLLTAVMEEKMERIAEVLLGTVTPFQFMAGKVLGSTGVALTTATIYIVGGVFTGKQLGGGNMIPYDILPWFFIFLVLFLIMAGSIMAALGSACNDNKDAQNMSFPAMLPMLLPLFVIMPVLRNPLGSLATVMSLIPPFTPMVMIVRQATPVTLPVWQPYAGLAGVILFTLFAVWAGSRIFRTGILMQGQKPTFANLVRYVFKSR